MLAEALEANRQLSEGLLEENARLRAALGEVLARDAERDAELESCGRTVGAAAAAVRPVVGEAAAGAAG